MGAVRNNLFAIFLLLCTSCASPYKYDKEHYATINEAAQLNKKWLFSDIPTITARISNINGITNGMSFSGRNEPMKIPLGSTTLHIDLENFSDRTVAGKTIKVEFEALEGEQYEMTLQGREDNFQLIFHDSKENIIKKVNFKTEPKKATLFGLF